MSSDRPDWRIAVIGDVGGHLNELRLELRRLGVDEEKARLPPDLTIIQVGDLIHRGPASEGVIALVDSFLTNQPGQWIQLVGNHEAQYLREPAFDWPERIHATSIDTLRRWWATGRMRAAAAVVTEGESFLVTHAGLTARFWRETLGAPSQADQAAAAINELIGSQDDALFSAGQMLRGRRKEVGAAGPIWAAAATELVPGWLNTRLPFSQIHGHASIYDWQHRRFRASAEIVRLTSVEENARHETTHLNGGRIIGVDPGHGWHARKPWHAWEIRT